MKGLVKAFYGGVVSQGAERGASVYSASVPVAELFAPYKGNIILIVNTASRCGFARQYDDLESLWQRYRDRGLLVVGFPSNDFRGQEPLNDTEIQNTCRINHGVTFPLYPKAPVTGPNKQPVFTFLTEHGPTELRGNVKWNFEKFLIDREGYLIGRWRSYVSPNASAIRKAIERAL